MIAVGGMSRRSEAPGRAVVVGVLGLVACLGIVACGSGTPSSTPGLSPCPVAGAPAHSGASSALGLDAAGATVPAWSAAIGRPSVIVGSVAYGTAVGHCVVATEVITGRILWTASLPSGLAGVIADGSTVLAATEVSVGHAPAAVFQAVNRLTAYDATTGRERWALSLPDDGQEIPAVLGGGTVVVSEADGSLLGVRESDGRELWRDPPPAGCGNSPTDGIQPSATMIGTATAGSAVTAMVGDTCPAGGGIRAIVAATGRALWGWQAPAGWEVDPQLAGTVDTAATESMVVVPIGLPAPANPAAVVAPPPAPATATRLANPYGYIATNDAVMVDTATGKVLWDLTGVVGQAFTSVGGSGVLCILTDAGADCRAALDGAPRWSGSWPGKNASAAYPALGCIDQVAISQPCVTSSGGLLTVALPTASAPAYPPQPGPTTSAGAFVIAFLEMATGTMPAASLTLPAFDVRSDHGVSISLPPAVLVAGDGMVLVSPQFEETDVVEAFAVPAGPRG